MKGPSKAKNNGHMMPKMPPKGMGKMPGKGGMPMHPMEDGSMMPGKEHKGPMKKGKK